MDWNDPNLKFVDLNGDGFADILLSEDEVFYWYPSLAKGGFGVASSAPKPFDEEKGPALVFADPTQSIFLADMTGDGLTDIVRIRWGGVCYWPNQGYGRFGSKVSMDGAPVIGFRESFDPKRVRLADIDGSGTTDLIYLGSNETIFWFNQAGNSFGPAQVIPQFPDSDSLSTVMAVDLLGIGTACLAWSSGLPGDAGRPLRYIDLMSGKKPHLLTAIDNQMGETTLIQYAPSTKFYLQDKFAGKPWLTRLPFPVQVVERVDVFDLINHNRFVTRYAYHHGHFDGIEREFSGFGMVEEWDTEEFGALQAGGSLPAGDNFNASSNIPPVHTKTWFHTGAYFEGKRLTDGFRKEYFQGDSLAWVPPPTLLPGRITLADGTSPDTLPGATADETREACRALKGSVLRQEIYADDDSAQSQNPYSAVDHAYTVEMLQPALGESDPGLEPPHGVFHTYTRETVSYHYERNPVDPRIEHQITLAVDGFGNVLKSASIGYGRRPGQTDPSLTGPDQACQSRVWVTYSESFLTNLVDEASAYRTPLTCESLGYELTGFKPAAGSFPFTMADFAVGNFAPISTAVEIPYEQTADPSQPQKRLISHSRTLFRSNDMTSPLPLGKLESLALPYQSYKLASTFGMISQAYTNPANPGQITDALNTPFAPEGGYLPDKSTLDGSSPAPHPYAAADGNLWAPSGKEFLSPDSGDGADKESAYARQHFYLPLRFQDPYGNVTTASYDAYDLMLLKIQDALGNLITAGIRDTSGNLTSVGMDYRLLQPWMLMDANRNLATLAFDTLGMVVGTAVMGKPEDSPAQGDSLAGFTAELTDAVIAAHLQNPLTAPGDILQQATTRLVYDLFAFQRTRTDPQPQPNLVYTLTRETHLSDLPAGQATLFQHAFSYSDGLGREIQNKMQAHPGPLDLNDPASPTANPRWIGSGWTLFNNKGEPVRQYEPFFSATHHFEFAFIVGVSPTFFYDPMKRVVATLHPDQTFEKVVFNPWRQANWDMNDTVLVVDPSADPEVGGFFGRIPKSDYWPTWYSQRLPGGNQSSREKAAAVKAAKHANTPSVSHLDSLGRIFLSISDNGSAGKYETRAEFDIEGRQKSVTDSRGNRVMTQTLDMLGNILHQTSVDAGDSWIFHNIAGNPMRSWDNRGYQLRHVYDALHRGTQLFVKTGSGPERLAELSVYGESLPEALSSNLLGRLYQHYDGSGLGTTVRYDFKGNVLQNSRQLLLNYKDEVDWAASPAPAMEPMIYTASCAFDALNRPAMFTTPDGRQVKTVIYSGAYSFRWI